MSTKKPWFPLYAADFLTDTQAMSHEALGAYFRLLCYQWINGTVPRPPLQMSRIIGCTLDELDTLWIELEPKFEGDHVTVRNARLERERDRADKISQGRAVGGRASGAARRKKPTAINDQEHLFDVVPDPFKQTGNENEPVTVTVTKDKTPPTPPRGKRAHRLPEDWQPDDKLWAWAKKEVPEVNVREETKIFLDYFLARGVTYVDWRRCWQKWMRTEQKSSARVKRSDRWTIKMANDFCIREHKTRHKGEGDELFIDRMRSISERGPT